eukprot:GEMP01038095.1.p1 GENE.GEMP01038095.1~~GEMP01038095.1.p1  ORF type:complete len:364 (+),score=81.29 GEMP01038095.1:74-1165(+)
MDALSQAKPSRPPDHSREHSRPRGDSERASRHERPPDPRDDRNDTAQVEPQELIRKVFSRRRGVSGHTASSRRQGPRTLKSEHNDTNALSTEPPKTVIAPPRVSPPPPALIQDYPNRQQPGKRMFPQGGATHILIASDCPTAEAAKKVTLLRNATPLSADYIHECVEKETSLDEEAFWPHQLPASSKTTPSAPSSPYQRTPRRLPSSLAVSNVRTGGMPDSANQRAHKEEMGVNSTLFSGLRFCAIGALPEGRFADLVSRGGEMLPQFGSPRVTHYIVSEVYAWERSRRKPLGRPVINLSWVDACIRKDRIISTPSRDAAPSSSSSRVSRQPHTRSHMEHNYALLDQPASALLGSNVRNFACI